jgi:hypothetical protein
MIIILSIGRMITNQGKYYSQKFTTDSNYSLNLGHTPVDHSQITFMHDPTGPNSVDRSDTPPAGAWGFVGLQA